MNIYNFISLLGIVLLFTFAWICSKNRKIVNWHVVVWGVGVQFLFAWFLFVVPQGTKVFLWINSAVVSLLDSAMAGAEFMFGPLAAPPGSEQSFGFIFAFQALPSIIFFSALMAILYYYNIIPKIIRAFAYVFTKLMRVSGAESVCAASNIFVGVESALTVKPYLKNMTKSELCTVLTAGMASVSSNVLAVYVFALQSQFPSIAGHLISASFLSAPAALAMSKVLYPETETPETLGEDIKPSYKRDNNLFEAIINGANTGGKLIFGIVVLLLAILGLVSLLDKILLWFGGHANTLFQVDVDFSLKAILGLIFTPFTYLLGIPPEEVKAAAQIIGERFVVTEVAAYQDLAIAMKEQTIQSPRTIVIVTYALCGFAHVASMAIFVGGIAAIVPEQTKKLAEVGPYALLAATLACLITACVAGIFFMENSILLS